MRYPTNMDVAGINVPVNVLANPVYSVYKCPVCKNADPDPKENPSDPTVYSALVLYIPFGDDAVCPCCKNPVQATGQHIWGKYDIMECEISISAPNEQAGGLNLVHETIEGINMLCDLGLDHTQISTLGAMLYKAFASGNVDFTPRANVPGTSVTQ